MSEYCLSISSIVDRDCAAFQEGPQRKKRKSEAGQVEEKADLLAMGTAAGTVLIYSTTKGALQCTLVGDHLHIIHFKSTTMDFRRLPTYKSSLSVKHLNK